MEDPRIPPPSPSPPRESGPTIESVVQSSFPLVDDSTDAPKPDQERAIHIESSEVYASVLQRDWEAVAALGMAMDVKHPLSSYPLRGEHSPPHMCFLFPYLVAELILGNSRAVLVRLETMESIVSQHPVFQSLQTVAYALSTHRGIFCALQHLEQVIQHTHDPRFDAELKEISLHCVKGLTQSHRAKTASDIGRTYTVISADKLSSFLGFEEDPELLDGYVRPLGWQYDPASNSYRPFPIESAKPRSTHLGFNDLNYLSTETLALDVPM